MVQKWMTISVLLAAIGLIGCSSNKIMLPTNQSLDSYRTPAQQEVLSDAMVDAIDKINTSAYSGKKVYVETLGVMPHTDTDLLDYVADSVRSHLAKGRATIVFPKYQGSALLPPDPNDVDYMVVVAVEAGGADNNVERSFLRFSGTKTLIAKARLRVTAYPIKGGTAEVASVSGTSMRTYDRWVFWFFGLSTPYAPTSSPLF